MVRDLVAEGATRGELRADVAPDELVTYCLHALAAAARLPSGAAVRRLVTVTMDGLRRAPERADSSAPRSRTDVPRRGA